MDEHDSRYSDCNNTLNVSQLIQMNYARGISSALCTCPLIIMLLVLCYSKAYTSLIQRLFLYLILASTNAEIFMAATMERQFRYSNQDKVCTALGFFTLWSAILFDLCAIAVIVYLTFLVFVSMKCSYLLRKSPSTRQKVLIESVYLVIVVVLPLIILWVPFMDGNYGLAVAWCWVRAKDENCNDTGLVDQILVGYAFYITVGILGIAAMIGISILYCRESRSANFVYVRKLLLQNLALLFFLLLYILGACYTLINRIIFYAIGREDQSYAVWILHSIVPPICVLIIPFGFLGSFYFEYLKKKLCQARSSKRSRARAQYEQLDNTAPLSERRSSPSSTYFEVPYTNGFTTV